MQIPKIDNQSIELALFALIAAAMLVQAMILMAAFFAMRKAARSMDKKIEDLRSSVLPLVEASRALFIRVAPRIDSTSEDVAAMVHALRMQTGEIQNVAEEMIARARMQAERFDSMVSDALDAMDRAGALLADCIDKPLRQLVALLAAAKAVIEALHNFVPAQRSRANRAAGDGDMFV
jgi:hypothetical protein